MTGNLSISSLLLKWPGERHMTLLHRRCIFGPNITSLVYKCCCEYQSVFVNMKPAFPNTEQHLWKSLQTDITHAVLSGFYKRQRLISKHLTPFINVQMLFINVQTLFINVQMLFINVQTLFINVQTLFINVQTLFINSAANCNCECCSVAHWTAFTNAASW